MMVLYTSPRATMDKTEEVLKAFNCATEEKRVIMGDISDWHALWDKVTN